MARMDTGTHTPDSLLTIASTLQGIASRLTRTAEANEGNGCRRAGGQESGGTEDWGHLLRASAWPPRRPWRLGPLTGKSSMNQRANLSGSGEGKAGEPRT